MNLEFKNSLIGSGDVISAILEGKFEKEIFSKSRNLFYLIETLVRQNMIYPRFRICVLNPDETQKYEIPQEDILVGGSYQENYQKGQRRTLSFTLNNNLGYYTPSVNTFWTGTKFSFEIGLQIPNQEDAVLWFKRGIYSISSVNPSNTDEQKTVSFSLKDKFGILESAAAKIQSTYTIPVGTKIKDVVIDILSQDNGAGFPLDPKSVIFHSSLESQVTQQTITGEAGQTWGSIILDLASMLSAEVFYNAEGYLTFVPIIEIMNDYEKPTVFDFYADEGDFKNDDYNLEMESIYNKVIVIGSNINKGTVRAEAINYNAESPINAKKIGIRTADVINDSAITSELLAQERADFELRKMSILQTTVNNSVCFNPLLTVNNIITVTDEFFKFKKIKLVLQSVSFSLGYDGIMSISSSNINNLNFNE